MSARMLIRGGCVLTLGARTPNLAEADVLIEDGKVAEVGRGLRARDAEQVDATDTIVMPGFVDTHRHVWESLFRNLGDAPTPASYSPRYQPDDIYAGTLIGLLGAIEAGITTVVDWSGMGSDQGFAEAALQAHADAGLRTVFVAAGEDGWRAELRRLAGAGTGPLVTLAAGCPEPAREDIDYFAGDLALARGLGLRIHAHAGVTGSARGSLADLGRLLGNDVTLVHCSRLDAADLDAISAAGASVSITPTSEMARGFQPPVQQLIDRGIRPGLGVDREQLGPGDMFAQMRATISLQHANSFDLKLAGKAGLPRLMTTREVIRYATVDGARAAGLGALTGTLEPGKQADIVILRADRPNIVPINDPIGAVVWGMDTSNVDWVIAGGRALVRQGALQADVERARGLAAAARRRVFGASGLTAAASGASN